MCGAALYVIWSGVFWIGPPPLHVAEDNDFVLRARVISALEGGPVILRVDLTYVGKSPLAIYPLNRFGKLSLEIQTAKSWKSQPFHRLIRTGVFCGTFSPSTRITPGTRWEAICYLHHDYQLIPVGTTVLRITQRIWKPGQRAVHESGRWESGGLLARPTIALALDLPKATPERLSKLAKGFQDTLRQPGSSDEERAHVANTILHTAHAEFKPIALSLLRSGSPVHSSELIEFIYDRSATPVAGQIALLEYLLEDHPAEATDVFEYWRGVRHQASSEYACRHIPGPRDGLRLLLNHAFRTPDLLLEMKLDYLAKHFQAKQLLLVDDQIRKLCQAPNVWVRAMSYANFADRCDRQWAAALLDDLRTIGQPQPAEEFQRLIGELNDKRFAIREHAAADLLRRGDVVAPALRELLKNPPSPEVEQRVKRILADIEKTPLDPLAQRAIAHLGTLAEPNSAARSMLEVLAKGAPGTRLTEEARKALEAARQRQPK